MGCTEMAATLAHRPKRSRTEGKAPKTFQTRNPCPFPKDPTWDPCVGLHRRWPLAALRRGKQPAPMPYPQAWTKGRQGHGALLVRRWRTHPTQRAHGSEPKVFFGHP